MLFGLMGSKIDRNGGGGGGGQCARARALQFVH